MASSIISRRKPKDYRPALWALTRMYAREAAKDAIRARGGKVSHYSAREIAVMADQLLMAEPGPFVARAKEVIAEWIAADQAKAASRKTVHILRQSVDSGADKGAQDKEFTL